LIALGFDLHLHASTTPNFRFAKVRPLDSRRLEIKGATEGASQQIYSLSCPPPPGPRHLRIAFQEVCTDTKNPAMFDDTRVSAFCITKTAYFCGSQPASQPFRPHRLRMGRSLRAARATPGERPWPGTRLATAENRYHGPSQIATTSRHGLSHVFRDAHHRSGIVTHARDGTGFAVGL